MELTTIKNALEFYAQSGRCTDDELVQISDTLSDCYELISRDVDDTVHIVPTLSLTDLLNIATYNDLGRMLKQNPDTTFEQYATIVRELLVSDLSNSTIELGYYFIRDLWNDNERYGNNKPDGTI